MYIIRIINVQKGLKEETPFFSPKTGTWDTGRLECCNHVDPMRLESLTENRTTTQRGEQSSAESGAKSGTTGSSCT